jgi:hypothetical protein
MEITRNDGMTIGIGSIPSRKRKAIYLLHGCRIDPVAYFDTDDHAQEISSFLMVMAEHCHNYKETLAKLRSMLVNDRVSGDALLDVIAKALNP